MSKELLCQFILLFPGIKKNHINFTQINVDFSQIYADE